MLIEVNCETDFMAKGDRFKELVADMAMQARARTTASNSHTALQPSR